jgi:hypothetical protein
MSFFQDIFIPPPPPRHNKCTFPKRAEEKLHLFVLSEMGVPSDAINASDYVMSIGLFTLIGLLDSRQSNV